MKNRQSVRLARALSVVLDTPKEDVMVSHDRFTIYRATNLTTEEYRGEEKKAVVIEDKNEDNDNDNDNDKEEQDLGKQFVTGCKNIHLDLNPWWWQEGSKDVLIGADRLEYSTLDEYATDFVKENNLVVCSMGPHVQVSLSLSLRFKSVLLYVLCARGILFRVECCTR